MNNRLIGILLIYFSKTSGRLISKPLSLNRPNQSQTNPFNSTWIEYLPNLLCFLLLFKQKKEVTNHKWFHPFNQTYIFEIIIAIVICCMRCLRLCSTHFFSVPFVSYFMLSSLPSLTRKAPLKKKETEEDRNVKLKTNRLNVNVYRNKWCVNNSLQNKLHLFIL